MLDSQPWTLLFIGGPSATGKSTLAASLADRFNASYVDADLFYVTLRRAVPQEYAPSGLQAQGEDYWSKPISELLGDYFGLQRYVCWAIEPMVSQHLRQRKRVIIEGTWLSPAFVTQGSYDGQPRRDDVRGLFLYEAVAGEMERRRTARANPWDRKFSEEVSANVASMRYELGFEMKRQAQVEGIPVLASQPFETLESRALAALDFAQDGYR